MHRSPEPALQPGGDPPTAVTFVVYRIVVGVALLGLLATGVLTT
ncbi:hypothetical protein ACI2L1_39620 [Streptomyces sp. NPDC019531]